MASVRVGPSPNHFTISRAWTAGCAKSPPEDVEGFELNYLADAHVARDPCNHEDHDKGQDEIRVGDGGGIVGEANLCERDQGCAEAQAQAVSGKACEKRLKQDHLDKITRLRTDCLERSEALEVLQNERVEGLTRDRKAHQEADHSHDQDVRS